MLVHHRGGDCEMQGRRSAVNSAALVKLSFDRRRVIDNTQTRATGERAKIARMLRRRRMIAKTRRGNPFTIPSTSWTRSWAFIDKEPISWRLAFEKRHGSFDSPNSPNERSGEQRDDTRDV